MSNEPRQDARWHYDRAPYDVGVADRRYAEGAGILAAFLREIDGGVAVDLGCGPANLMVSVAERAALAIGIDISEVTLRRARARVSGATAVWIHADARRVPLRDASADRILATGSLHHTGNAEAGFAELCRVLKPGGRAFVAVYRTRSYYHAMYRLLSPVARRVLGRRVLDAVVNGFVIKPAFALYFIAGRSVLARRLTIPKRSELESYYADQILNPVVSFHSLDDLSGWAAAYGVRIVRSATTHGGALLQSEFVK